LKTHVQERKDSLVIDLKSLKDKIVIANYIIMKSKANFDHYRTEKEMLKIKIDNLSEMGSHDSTRTHLNDHLTEICRTTRTCKYISTVHCHDRIIRSDLHIRHRIPRRLVHCLCDDGNIVLNALLYI
jgi:hypothetical protein